MTTNSITSLMCEAKNAALNNDYATVNKIQCILGEQTAGYNKERGVYDSNTPGAGLTALFDHLFVKCMDEREAVHKHLPTILMLCGERGNMLFTD
jgi:hypothetical protein